MRDERRRKEWTRDKVLTDGLITVEEHLERVLDAARPLPSETISLAGAASPDAAGRVLASPVIARVDIPVFDNSAMDGFAVHFDDVASASNEHPVTLRVVADLPAGTDLDPRLGAGKAARIMTGSPVPADADAIVPFEYTEGGLADSLDTAVVTHAPAERGAHIRGRGSDTTAATEIVSAGIPLGAFALSAAAAASCSTVTVHRRPRVAVVSTGSELVSPGSPLRHGQIPESNSVLLSSLAAAAGAEVVLRTSVADDESGLRSAIADARAHAADVLVFSGGVSAGAYEVVKSTLDGGEMGFYRVAMQPGKPQGFGVLDTGALMFGLPGNPVSAAVSFEVFVRPTLRKMQGYRAIHRETIALPAGDEWHTPPSRRQYLPAVIDRTDPARWTVRPATAGGSRSHLTAALAQAEAFAIVPAEVAQVCVGDLVQVMLLD